MKRSPAHSTERHEFSNLSSLPWRRLPGHSSMPWIGFDPELQSDCSAAYRAFRLVMLALFALLGAGSRAQAQSSGRQKEGSLEARIETQQKQIDELKALVLRQAQQLESQQQAINELRKDERAGLTAVALPAQPATVDERESAHLTVNRANAPPQTDNSSTAIQSGFGQVQFHGLLQAWYSGGNLTADTFRIRRAEIKFTGTILSKLNWTLMIDPAKALAVNRTFATVTGSPVLADASVSQSSRILQDAFIGYDPLKAVRFKVGQFKFPLGLEAQYANSDLPTVERALFMSDRGRGGDLADVRDIGAMAWGSLGSPVDYQFGIFNGAGDFQNQTDTTDRKELVGRIAIRPLGSKWFQIGSSGAWSSASRTTTVDPRRNRLGGELMLRPGKLTFITEVMGGLDGAIRRIGGYSHLAYRFGRWEPISRFDFFDPDTAVENSSATVAERDYIAGLNYYLREHHAKLQFNYLRKTFNGQLAPARNLVLVNLQTMW